MKKLTIILLALAMAAFAVPAFAGDVSVSGTYTLDGENYTGQGDTQDQWYDDEMEVIVKISQGDVTAVLDLEPTDDENFDGTAKDRTGDLIDNYYVQWKAREDLSVKIGEYGLSFGRKVVIYADPAAHHIGLTYSGLANADLGLYIGKVEEMKNDDDTDTDSISLLVNVKGVEFFKKFDFLYVTQTDKADSAAEDDVNVGYVGFDSAFSAGPVAVALEYGSVSSDVGTDEGNFIYAELGFDELAGFDINLEVFQSSFEDGSLETAFGENDFFPYMIYGFRSASNQSLTDVQLIGISGSYKINDKMTAMGKILASGSAGPDDEAVGMEIDAHLKYKFSDNASAQLTYATWAPGKAYETLYGDDSETDMRARLVLTF